MDFENVFRSTNTGNVTATSFWPFSSTVGGHLTEYRSTGQYSRFNLKITRKYGANNITGYIEGDFELGGLLTSVRITDIPSVAGATFVKHGAIGGGFMGGINAELFKNFRFVAGGMVDRAWAAT